MPESYDEIFRKRGQDYHAAMLLCPKARDHEFLAAIEHIPEQQKGILMDCPAGGDYLASYLQKSHPAIEYQSFEPCSPFASHSQPSTESFDFTQLPWQNNCFETWVTLAAAHHFIDRPKFYAEAYRVLKANGTFIIGDVIEGSAEHTFLNGFVNEHNSMGHQGDFLDPDQEKQDIINAGFQNVTYKKHAYAWNFDNLEETLNFCRGLFGIDQANNETLQAGLESHLKLSISDHSISLPWTLGFWTAQKAS